MRNDGEEGVWYSFREDNVKMPICRQTQLGHLVEWETAPVPTDGKEDRVTFVFAGGLGYRSEPKTDGFVFLVNGSEQVRFDLPEQTNQWQSADGRVTMRFRDIAPVAPRSTGIVPDNVGQHLLPARETLPVRRALTGTGQPALVWSEPLYRRERSGIG